MRLYKINKEVDFPERVSNTSGIYYKNIRSAERIDVRPDEIRHISTGLRISFKPEKETVYIISYFNSMKYEIIESGIELVVPVENLDKRNIMIFPGRVLGEVRVEKK